MIARLRTFASLYTSGETLRRSPGRMRYSEDGIGMGSAVCLVACNQYRIYSICADEKRRRISPFSKVPDGCNV